MKKNHEEIDLIFNMTLSYANTILESCEKQGRNAADLTPAEVASLMTSPQIAAPFIRSLGEVKQEKMQEMVKNQLEATRSIRQKEFMRNPDFRGFATQLDEELEIRNFALNSLRQQHGALNSKAESFLKPVFLDIENLTRCKELIEQIFSLQKEVPFPIPELIVQALSSMISSNAAESTKKRRSETQISESNFLEKLLQAMLDVLQVKLRNQLILETRDTRSSSKAMSARKAATAAQQIFSRKAENTSNIPTTPKTQPETDKKPKPKPNIPKPIANPEVHRRKMEEGGFTVISQPERTSPSRKPEHTLPVAERVLRWDFSSFECDDIINIRTLFLRSISNFSDWNEHREEIKRYQKMSNEQLTEQYRRHYIPQIEMLLADAEFLRKYGQKTPFFNESHESYLFVVQDNQNPLQNTEILSIGIKRQNEERVLHHCFIHPENESLPLPGNAKNHFLGISHQIPSSSRTVTRRTTTDQIFVDENGKLVVSYRYPFSTKERSICFLPIL